MMKSLIGVTARRLAGVTAAAVLGVTGAALPTAPVSASTGHVTGMLIDNDFDAPFKIEVRYTTSGNRLSVNRIGLYTLSSHHFLL